VIVDPHAVRLVLAELSVVKVAVEEDIPALAYGTARVARQLQDSGQDTQFRNRCEAHTVVSGRRLP
jgi:hypothetical protein